ncbi:hypothetical protein EGH22_16830 [Halomicroarcula sp. F28]|uniref:phage NrS-1 polymerase family protein n=1 Tax=Haloarcula salinisoli TaxID=2487746 RepID=UPI001C7323C2|nr:hypothetical protein [Halomicroarcula salinisoli]MBX0288000.1 hypothetical protein [Halomicroarcula salinisoli]
MPIIDVRDEEIPEEIRPIENWICWREGERDGKPTKIPTKPYRTSGSPNLDVTDPNQRRDFEQAVAAHGDSRVNSDGLGFVFTEDVSIAGVDLDKCRDADTGELEEWAEDIIDRLDSYTEVSPSGTGVHILVGGELPDGGNRKGRVEMYDSDRYFTVTGEHVDGTPREIRICQDDIEAVHRDFIRGGIDSDGQASLDTAAASNISKNGGNEADSSSASGGQHESESLRDRYGDDLDTIEASAVRDALARVDARYLPEVMPKTFDDLAGPGVELSDEELLSKMFDAKGGSRQRRLYDGDSSMWGSPQAEYPSQSEADMAMAHYLAFWTGKDPAQMDALFRDSGLYREKWDRRHYSSGSTYGDVTIARALLRVDDYYELPSANGKKFGGSSSNGTREATDASTSFDDSSKSSGHAAEADPGTGLSNAGGAGDASDGVATDSPSAGSKADTEPSSAFGGDAMPAPDPPSPTAHTDPPVRTPDAVSGDSVENGYVAEQDEHGRTPASPRGLDTDDTLRESTQEAMELTAAAAGKDWERTDPHLTDDEKHANDWSVPREGRTPTQQALDMAREDNRILARKLRRESQQYADYHALKEENERVKLSNRVYLQAIDELMSERHRYRELLRQEGLLSEEDARLPDHPTKHLKAIIRPMIRREDTPTAKETLTGIDAVLQQYTEANEQIRGAERQTKTGVRDRLSRLFG